MNAISPHQPTAEGGFTLVELLIGLVISGVALIAAGDLLINHILTSESMIWGMQMEKGLGRLSNLLATEAGEACALGTTTNPSSCALASTCSSASANEIRLMVPILSNGVTITNRWIRYFRNTTNNQLLRDGPRILPSGALDTANPDQTNMLVMEGISNFLASGRDNCHSATIQVTATAPNTSYSRTREMTLRTGVNQSID